MRSLTKYIWLAFLLLIAIAYPNSTVAQNASSVPSKQTSGNETITGAFGIKFGEDIKPYIKGNDSGYGRSLTENDFVNFKILEPPVNINEIPNVRAKLLGIADDNNRVITLWFKGNLKGIMMSCETNNSAVAMRHILREKYKITKPQEENRAWLEEYGDGEGNNIQLRCEGFDSFDITYTSHLMSDYIARLKANQQKKKDDIKKSLNKGM